MKQTTRFHRLAIALLFALVAHAAAPVIATSGVFNAASFQPGLASGTWISITGAGLATTTRIWQSSDFKGNQLPISLDGVSVKINAVAAYVYYISPTQINVLAPDDPAIGPVPVQVTNAQGTSNTVMANKQAVLPALFGYSPLGGTYAIAQDPRNYALIAPPGLFGNSVVTLPAVPGQILTLYGTGLGPVTSNQPSGQIVQAVSPLVSPVRVTFGGKQAAVQFAGLIGSGLFQINLTVPDLPIGDAAMILSTGNATSDQKFIPVTIVTPAAGQPNPAVSGCVTGQVDSITWSLQHLYLDLPDELSIGQTKLCPSCSVKAPIYPEMLATLEAAIAASRNVQACYDGGGNVFQVRMARP